VEEFLAVDTWCRRRDGAALTNGRPAVEVDIFEVESMNVSWDITQETQAKVDEEIGAAAGDDVDADGRQEDGDEDEKDG